MYDFLPLVKKAELLYYTTVSLLLANALFVCSNTVTVESLILAFRMFFCINDIQWGYLFAERIFLKIVT